MEKTLYKIEKLLYNVAVKIYLKEGGIYMNRISFKLLAALAIFLFVAVLPIAVLATNEDVSLVSTNNDEAKTEYIIYIKDYSNQKFKYAFTTNANPGEMDLSYINSILDLGENQAAFLDAKTYENLSKESSTIFMWAKDEEENLILKGIQLDFTKSLTKEDIQISEKLTQRIKVEIADSEEDTTTIRNENVDGVEETVAVGYVKIIDDENAKYFYERTKLPSSEEYNQLMKLAEQIKNEYDELDIYEKIQFGAKFNELYSKVMSEANWNELEGTMIEQPEESVAGDKYIVLLKKVDEQGKTTMDIQFLTAFDAYKPNVVKEEVVKQETSKLPITYDSIALFVILAIIVALMMVIIIRMKWLSKNNEK